MATTPAKKSIARRTIAADAVREVPSAGDIVQAAGEAHIALGPVSEAESAQRVTVVVPQAFTLTRDDGSVKHYGAGTQEMPAPDADHWFAKARGVLVYKAG